MVAKPRQSVRFTFKRLGVRDWSDCRNPCQGDDRLDGRVSYRLALLSLQHISDAPYVDSVHTKPRPVRSRDGHHGHWPDLPLHHEVPGHGVELCRHPDAAVVRVLPVELTAELPTSDSLDIADDSVIRRYARGYRKRRIFGLALQIGSRIELDLFHFCDRFLPVDVRGGAIARAVGEAGITKSKIGRFKNYGSKWARYNRPGVSASISSGDGPIPCLPSPFGARDQDRRAAPLRFYHCSRELRLKPAEGVSLRVGAEGFPIKGLRKCASCAGEFTATACY